MRLKHKIRALLLASFLSGTGAAVSAQEALAFDAGAFVRQMEEQIAAQGGTFTYDRLTEEENGFTLEGARFEISDENNSTSITLDKTSYSNVEERDDGNFLIGNVLAEGYRQTVTGKKRRNDEVVISAETLAGEDLLYTSDTKAPLAAIGKLSLSELEIRNDRENEPVLLSSPGFEISGFEFDNPTRFRIASVAIEPLVGRGGKESEPVSFGFEGGSLEGFARLSTFGFNIDEFSLGGINFSGVDGQDRKIAFSFEGASGSNLYVPDATDPDQTYAWTKPLELQAGELSFSYGGKEVFGWKGSSSRFKSGPKSDGGGWKADLREAYFNVDSLPIDNPQQRQGIEQFIALGYERIVLDFLTSGIWDAESGVLNIDQYRLDIKDAGAIDISTAISGYTRELARRLSGISNRMNAETDPKKREALSLQLLASMAVLSVNDMRISVEDASLLKKLLNLQAEQTGRQPEELSAIVGPMVAIALSPFKVPEFASSLADALNTFMQGEKTITATISPEGGLGVTEMIALGSGAQAGSIPPAELIERLNLKITAE